MTKKVLTIDDTKTLRMALAMTLTEAGHEVVEAVDGKHGLEVYDQEAPDVIITDLNMPVMDGIEFVRECRSRPDGTRVPIIILTTETSSELKMEGRRAGATGWMVKPYNPEKLLSIIDRVCP